MKVKSLIPVLVLICALTACGKDKNVTSNALGGCVLDEPIDAKETTQKEIYYDEVVTDQGPAKAFSLFAIRNWNQDSGLMGGAIWENSGRRYGFKNSYAGNMNLNQDLQEVQGIQVLTTTEKDSEDSIINELKVAFKNEKIFGISLTYPSGVGSKTVCIKSMKQTDKPVSKKNSFDKTNSPGFTATPPTASAPQVLGPDFTAQVQEAANLGYFYPDLNDSKTYWYFPLDITKKLVRPGTQDQGISNAYYYGTLNFQTNSIMRFAHLKGISPDDIKPIMTGNIQGGFCENTASLNIYAAKGYDSLEQNVRLEFRSSVNEEIKSVEAGNFQGCFAAVQLGTDKNTRTVYVHVGF